MEDAQAVEWWAVNQTRLARVKALLGDALGVVRAMQGELDAGTADAWEISEKDH